MTGQVTFLGVPWPQCMHTYSLSNGCINYIIYAVYRTNATGQVDKKKLLTSVFTILVLEQLRAARDKKWSFPALPPTVPVSNSMRHTTYQPIGPDYSPAYVDSSYLQPELHICCTVK
jgi:hypothetical protein